MTGDETLEKFDGIFDNLKKYDMYGWEKVKAIEVSATTEQCISNAPTVRLLTRISLLSRTLRLMTSSETLGETLIPSIKY